MIEQNVKHLEISSFIELLFMLVLKTTAPSTEYVVKIQSCPQANYEETYQRKSRIKDHSLSSLKNPVDELKESLCGPESVH